MRKQSVLVMPKKIKQEYKFTDFVIKKILDDGSLLIKISNVLGTDIVGLQRMIDRDSQAIMHVQVCTIISEKYNLELKSIYQRIRK